mmetsp:Transcript_12496/g.26795  ORF Transcript_12496/g.26795 Transcript_12496/m.26795 type:complete len:345 (+) Transcript_12496:75-1109(+)
MPTHAYYFGLERARSGSSSCKHCKGKIAGKELRFWYKEEEERGGGPFFHHIDCLELPPEGLEIDQVHIADDVLEDKSAMNVAMEALDRAQERRIERGLKNKAKATDRLAHVHVTPRVDRENKAKPTKEQLKSVYGGMKMDEMKEYLRINHYPVSGSEAELIERCAEGELHGSLPPKCPTCKWGRLKMEEGRIVCSGYYNYCYTHPCPFSCQGEDTKEIFHPWVYLEDAVAALFAGMKTPKRNMIEHAPEAPTPKKVKTENHRTSDIVAGQAPEAPTPIQVKSENHSTSDLVAEQASKAPTPKNIKSENNPTASNIVKQNTKKAKAKCRATGTVRRRSPRLLKGK